MGKPREVLAYVYYPAIPTGNKAEYFPGLKDLEGANETRFLRRQFGTQWHAVAGGTLLSNAYDGPPLSTGSRKFPVLIFSPGDLAPVLAYQIQLQELASRGYVIFGLEHGTDSALLIRPDHTLLPYVSRRAPDPGPPTVGGLEANRDSVIRRTADIRFAIDQIERLAKSGNTMFRDRLDLTRIGAFGHSMGGKAVIRACQADRRLRACVNQDGEMFGIPFASSEPISSLQPDRFIDTPVLVMYVAEPGIPDAQLAAAHITGAQYQEWRSAKNRALREFLSKETRDSELVTITASGFVHASFMDPRLLGDHVSTEDKTNSRTGVEITTDFFDWKLQTGDQGAWSKFVLSPGTGVAVERLSGSGTR